MTSPSRAQSNVYSDREFLSPKTLANLENLEFVARSVVEGFLIGLHKSPFHGFSAEFANYRKYSPGDDIRFIDWKLQARTDRWYIKQFEENTNTRAHIILDCSASMGVNAGTDGVSKFHYARMLAASLAHLILKQNDAVGLWLFNDSLMDGVGARSRSTQFRDILSKLEKSVAQGGAPFNDALRSLPARIGRRGLVLLISDCLADADAIIEPVRAFAVRGHEVVVFNVLTTLERQFPLEGMTEFIDSETGDKLSTNALDIRDAYLSALKAHTADLRRRCREMAIDFVELTSDTPIEIALRAYLTSRK